jgi:hypothetical protein
LLLLTLLKHEERKSLHIQSFLEEAKAIANTNVGIFSQVISSDTPLIGIEPSY